MKWFNNEVLGATAIDALLIVQAGVTQIAQNILKIVWLISLHIAMTSVSVSHFFVVLSGICVTWTCTVSSSVLS